MNAAIATGFFLGFAASLSGCGPGSTCPLPVEGPTKTISFTPEGDVLLIDIGEDFDAEVITAEGSDASVTVEVVESLESNILIKYNDFSAHDPNRKELTVSMVPALGDIGCTTGVKVAITLPKPAMSFFGNRGTSTVDILTWGANSRSGSLTVGLLNGSDIGLTSQRAGQLIVNSVQATTLEISTGDTYMEDRLNGATLAILGGEVSDSVNIVQESDRSSIELNDLTTQSATISQSIGSGSLTGMRSQNCSISFGGSGTITTEVSQTVDCAVSAGSTAAGKITIDGDAAKAGSCFERAQDVEALV